MGLLEDIGNALGNAVGALSNFIGEAFDAMIREIFNGLASIGATVLRHGLVETHGSETDLMASTAELMKDADTLFDDDISIQLDELVDYTGELPGVDAAARLALGWFKSRETLMTSAQMSLILEAATMGQVEGGKEFWSVHNNALALPQLVNNYSKMKWDTALFLPFQRFLNNKYQNNLPGATDIVRFALREVFDDDQRQILLTPRPGSKYYDTMHEHGFTDYWSDSYWAAHWILPSVSQLNEMLHRGKIEVPEWEKYVRYNDFLPEMIPKLKEIIYRPYTRVDVRRMYDVGVLSDEELLQAYKDLGYDTEHADNMTLWTKVYIAVGELRARYSKGWITKEELKQSFVDLGMSDAKATTYMEKLGKAETDASEGKQRDLTKTDITRSVAKGLISREDGIDRLIELGYDEQEATLLIDAVVKEAVAEEIAVDRDVSKTEIIEGVKLGIISRADSIPMLTKLGYSEDEANYILDLRVLPVHIDRIVKERDLTKAEIVKGVKKGIITDGQAAYMLMDMGYDNAEAWYIIDINVEAATGSPHSWSEFQRIVNRDRKARGLTVKTVPEAIPELENKIKELESKLAEAKAEKKTRQEIMAIETTLNPMKRQHAELVRHWRQ